MMDERCADDERTTYFNENACYSLQGYRFPQGCRWHMSDCRSSGANLVEKGGDGVHQCAGIERTDRDVTCMSDCEVIKYESTVPFVEKCFPSGCSTKCGIS